MGGPGRHFGENASLDPSTQADILRFPEANAAEAGTRPMGRRAMQGVFDEDTVGIPK